MIDRTKAPEHHAIERLSLPPEQVRVLPNGVTLHVFRGGDQPVATLRLVFDGGAEECANPALQSLYSQLLAEGTRNRTALEVSEELDFNGARYSPIRSNHHTGFRLGMLCRRAAPLMALMKDIFTAPLFGEKELEAAKTAETARLNYVAKQMPTLAVRECAAMVCGPDHPSSRIAGADDVRAVTPDDLRRYHASLCGARGCHAYLSGDITDDILSACADFLEVFPDRAGMTLRVRPFEQQAPGVRRIVRDYARQSAVVAGMEEINRTHKDYHNLRLAVMALGGYFGSRLMSELRERQGLTYGISAALCALADGAYVNISAQCSHDKVSAVLDGLAAEMRRLATEPPRGEELERLRMHALTEALQTLDNPDTILGQYMLRRTVALPDDYFARQQQAISELSPEVIADMAAKYLNPAELRIAVAGA